MEERAQAGIQREYRQSVLTWLHLVRVHNLIAHAEQSHLDHFDISPAQFDVLSHLAKDPGLSQQALADRLLVTKGNVTSLLDRMERTDYVERQPDPDDRRSNQLYITGRGKDVFTCAAPALEAELSRQFESLQDEELNTLMRLLAKLDRSLRHED